MREHELVEWRGEGPPPQPFTTPPRPPGQRLWRVELARWFVVPSPHITEYARAVRGAWHHMNRFFDWGCVERRGQRPLVARGEQTALHLALLYMSNFLIFSFALPALMLLALLHFILTAPALMLCAAVGATEPFEFCLVGLAIPDDDDEAQGWAWLFILPIVGGSLLLAWLLFTVVWAPCVFMISALSSPLWAGPILWAPCQVILTWRQASEAIRVVAHWPAYYIYVLGFYDFEDDYIDIEPLEDGTI